MSAGIHAESIWRNCNSKKTFLYRIWLFKLNIKLNVDKFKQVADKKIFLYISRIYTSMNKTPRHRDTLENFTNCIHFWISEIRLWDLFVCRAAWFKFEWTGYLFLKQFFFIFLRVKFHWDCFVIWCSRRFSCNIPIWFPLECLFQKGRVWFLWDSNLSSL